MATDSHEPLDPRLMEAIATLRDTPPSEDLWPEIAPQLTPRHPAGTFLLRWPTAIAAGLVIASASIGGTLLLLRSGTVVPPAATAAQAPLVTPATNLAAAHTPADQALQQAIGQLEARLASTQETLDPKTREGIRASLAALDQVIADAATLQRATPDDPRSAHILTSALQKKLDVLRTVTRRTAIRT